MEPIEYDVYVSYRAPGGAELAREVSDGLARRGFRVFASGDQTAETDARIVEDAPDFVLLLTRNCLDRCTEPSDPLRAQIARALQTERNIVPVAVRGYEHPAQLPPDLAALRTRPTVPYSEARRGESIARIAHRLSSDASVDDRHVMRNAKQIFTAVGLLLAVLLAIAAIRTIPGMITRYLASRPLAPMTLYWSVFAQRPDTGGAWTEVMVKDGSAMLTGDRFRLAFAVSSEGRAYAVARTRRGDIAVLFPGRGMRNASAVHAGQIYSAPGDAVWWSPEDGGAVDRLYIFASYDPIENLESLLDDREESAAERQALLDSTVEGLLDGKHGGEPLRIRTRAGRQIVRAFDPGSSALTASATLESGASVTHTLNQERGLLSAMVELRLAPGK